MKRRTGLQRRGAFLKRNSPLKRGGKFARKSASIARVTPERADERREYNRLREEYLRAHPYCQIWIAERGLDEAEVIATLGYATTGFSFWKGERVPLSTQIHHRNKCRRARLTDFRFVMAASQKWHDEVENRKSWARDRGYLFPIQADENGRWGAGNQGLTTPELMASRVVKAPDPKVQF